MTILFSNPPWWEGKESRGFLRKKRWRRGVRAGSRWPFTYQGRCTPDNPRAHDYIPYPFSWDMPPHSLEKKLEKIKFFLGIALLYQNLIKVFINTWTQLTIKLNIF